MERDGLHDSLDSLVIRRVRRDEAAQVRSLRLAALSGAPEAFARSYAEEAEQPPAFWEERARAAAETDAVATFVAVAGELHVGTATCLLPAVPGPATLVGTWVEPGWRRRGVGSRLIRAVSDWAAAQGATGIGLVVHQGNDEARRLYQRAGFAPAGEPETGADGVHLEQGMYRLLGSGPFRSRR